MQILVNTLSFARVGAFALAHSALSAAVVTVAAAAGSVPGWLLVMVLGNLLIIGLEGLVVSIQTTRLVLFEFFNRFLVGTGRVFRPLPAPSATLSGGD
jgi:V/A-type H+-transporting ATPase subunit I